MLGRAAAATGLVITLLMVSMKVLPQVPGHFTFYEWIALGTWILLGVLLRRPGKTSEPELQRELS